MRGKYRLLMLHTNPTPPADDPRRNMLHHVSSCCYGDLISPIWFGKTQITRERVAAWNSALGAFAFHPLPSIKWRKPVPTIRDLAAYVSIGLRLSRRDGPYDAIVTYGAYTAALAGLAIKRRTGARLIVMLPNEAKGAFGYYPGALNRIKGAVAPRLTEWVLRRSDAAWILYAQQLDVLHRNGFPPAFVLWDLVPVSLIRAHERDWQAPERYILFLGFPFHLKGVDTLIKAFNQIAGRHPDVTLRIVGHCPDRTPYERLANGNQRVRFEKAVANPEAMEIMSDCSLFVLPSRTEAMGKVLIEAMAARKPIVASRVGGIPSLIEHEHNGLLFEADDVADLAAQMDRVLADRTLAASLADAGYRKARTELAEERFVERFRAMLGDLVGRR